ncbi:HAMP domain-containing protein [Bacillaceae bacterium SIJ1]|uniref:methyl-accepting chemotaxis protein n=1 Tax=Litoribacterium kuwaitense TaxID=1398745 RepID=UPI0013E9A235|nr:methyl-accepting chemotaxis protein [Litoribacterium kuwaitense]NGP45929.1 HAMP domain-containing protein [Litoribacterium kuwaitense]
MNRTAMFRNMPIGWKYGIALASAVMLFALSSIVVYINMNDVEKEMNELRERSSLVSNIAQLNSLIQENNIQIADYITTPNAMITNQFAENNDSIYRLQQQIEPFIETAGEKEFFSTLVEKEQQINTLFLQSIVPYVQAGDMASALEARHEVRELRDEAVLAVSNLRMVVDNQQQLMVYNARAGMQEAIVVLVISLASSTILGPLLVWWVNRYVRRDLNNVVATAQHIAEGRLDVEKIAYEGKDEIGQLGQAITQMRRRLKEMLHQVQQVSDTVTTQSGEVTSSANEIREGSMQVAVTMQGLFEGSEHQASEATSISRTMSSFLEAIRDASEHGDQVEDASVRVHQMTENGQCLMKQSTKQMQAIEQMVQGAVHKVERLDKESQKISSLTETVESIARQTNLLALNAAIEAARAGEQGKGFVIVAEEVRSLSGQVAHAIEEMTQVIGSVQTETAEVVKALENGYREAKNGQRKIEETSMTFDTIESSVSEMTEHIQSITKRLSGMVEGSTVIKAKIDGMTQIADQSALAMEEASASVQQSSSSMETITSRAEQLAQQADGLNGLLRRFSV